MIKSLRKLDFSHSTGHDRRTKFSPPPEKTLGAPLAGGTAPGRERGNHRVQGRALQTDGGLTCAQCTCLCTV